MIRVESIWMAVKPLDMRVGTEAALARVVLVFGAARPHHAYLFANRMKVLVHDGFGVWLAARRLNSGKFAWPKNIDGTLTLSRPQFDALVLGLPWQLVPDGRLRVSCRQTRRQRPTQALVGREIDIVTARAYEKDPLPKATPTTQLPRSSIF